MDDFLRQFKENLDQQPTPEYQEADWEALSSHLDQEPASGTHASWGWVLGTIVLLLVGSNFYFFQQLNVANQKLTQLEVQVDSTTQHLHSTIENQTDENALTFNLSNVEQKSNSKNLETIPPNSPESPTNLTYTPSANEIKSSKRRTVNQGSKREVISYSPSSPSSIKSIETLKDQVKSDQQHIQKPSRSDHEIPQINISNTPPVQALQVPEEQWKADRKESISTPQQSVFSWPSQFSIGMYAGAGLATNRKYDQSQTLQYGVQAYFHFSPSWSLFTNLDFTHLDYEVAEMDRTLGISIIPFNQDDFSIQRIDVDRTIRSFDIGLQYQFLTTTRLQPFLGASLGTSSLIENNVSYHFTNLLSGQSLSENRTLPEVDRQRFGSIKTGMNWSWTKHFHLGFEAIYIHRFEHADHQLPKLLQGRIQMRYQF